MNYRLLLTIIIYFLLLCTNDPSPVVPDQQRDELKNRGSISGYVYDKNGHPLKNVLVEIDSGKGTPDNTDENGFFNIKEVIDGTFELNFIHSDYINQVRKVTLGFAKNDTIKDTVRLSWGYFQIAGTVVQNGELVEGAGVSIAGSTISTLTKNDGSFIITRVPRIQKPRLICARNPGGYTILDVTDSLQLDTIINVGKIIIDKKGADVQGIVYDLNGDPLPWVTVKAVGGGVWNQTDASGKYYLSNVPTGESSVRISVITRDSTLIGSVCGLVLDNRAIATGVDIRMHRLADLTNGMFLETQDLIIPDTVKTVTLITYPVTSPSTIIDEYQWLIGDSLYTSKVPKYQVKLSVIKNAASIAVRAKNSEERFSDKYPISINIRNSKPVIDYCGVSKSADGQLMDSVIVNLGSILYFSSRLTDPIGGIDSVSWDFGDGSKVQKAGVFTLPVDHEYATSGTYLVKLRAKDIEKNIVRDTLKVKINTVPVIGSKSPLPQRIVAGDTLKVTLTTFDADKDSVLLKLPQTYPFFKLSKGILTFSPAISDTGTYQIEVIADDRRGGSDTLAFNVKVILLPNKNATLADLKVSSGKLQPIFDPIVFDYIDSVISEEQFLRFTPTASDPNAQILVDKETVRSGYSSSWIELKKGADTIVVTVTAEDTTVKQTYSIIIRHRPGSDAFISGWSWSNSMPGLLFSPGKTGYTDTVSQTISSISVKLIIPDDGSKATIDGKTAISGVFSDDIILHAGNNIIRIEVTAPDGISKKVYTAAIFRRLGTSANLTTLTSTDKFTPGFSASVLQYKDTVPYETGTYQITAETEDAGAVVLIGEDTVASGKSFYYSLSTGLTNIPVKVISESGLVTKQYHIIVSRMSDVALASLSPSGSIKMIPAFNPEIIAYACTVSNEIDRIRFTPTARRASMVSDLQIDTMDAKLGVLSDPLMLSVGTKSIPIIVNGVDGFSKCTYTVSVTRLLSDNAKLSLLTTSSGTLVPKFNPDTLVYRDSIDKDIANIQICPTTAHSEAAITVNGNPVTSGSNSQQLTMDYGTDTVRVVVTAANNTQKTYKIVVVRAPNKINTLTSLTVSSGSLSPKFTGEDTLYTVYVPNEIITMAVTPTADEPRGVVKLNGTVIPSGSPSNPVNLSEGVNHLLIEVTAMDGVTKRRYHIDVTRYSKNSIFHQGLHVTTADTLKKVNSPYHFLSSIEVDEGAVLVVESGVVVEMDSGVGINIAGTLIARGTAADSIYFRAYQSDKPWGTISFSGTDGGAVFDGNNKYVSGSIMEYCSVNWCGASPNAAAVIFETKSAYLNRSSICNSLYTGISCNAGPVVLRNLVVSENCIAGAGFVGMFLDANAIVDSCTIGNNTGNAGISINNFKTITFNNCIIHENTGSGVVAYNSDITLNHCGLTNNTTTGKGGAIYTYGSSYFLILNDCIIADNKSAEIGGGIYIENSTSAVLKNCEISRNEAPYCSAICTNSQSDSIINCKIESNKSETEGASTIGLTNNSFLFANTLNNPNVSYEVSYSAAQGSAPAKCSYNYWGFTDINAINSRIYDYFDDNTKAVVDFEPFLTTSDASVVNDLISLSVSTGTLTPYFKYNTVTYKDTVTADCQSIQVCPTAVPGATIKVEGTTIASGNLSPVVDFKNDKDTVNVEVTSLSGKKKTYKVIVVRAPNSFTALTGLALSSGTLTPAFDSTDTSYSVNVANTVSQITVKPIALERRSTIRVNGTVVTSGSNSSAITLPVGRTDIPVEVTAMDGIAKRTYHLSVYRISSSSYLNGFTVSGFDTLKKSNSPYRFMKGILVESGATLVIEPGVVMEMDPGVAIDIKGTLIARGTATDSIFFKPYYDTTQHWGYITFSGSDGSAVYDADSQYVSGSIIEYCVIDRAGAGNAAVINVSKAVCLQNSTFSHSSNGISVNVEPAILRDLLIYENGNASGWGGLFLTVKTKLEQCRIMNNYSSAGGGAVYINSGAVDITGCSVIGNISSYVGGAIFCNSNASLSIDKCVISDNNAAGEGGGIYSAGAVTINNSVIKKNVSSSTGGGICSKYNNLLVKTSLIAENEAAGVSGIYLADGTDSIVNCTIIKNKTVSGGAVQTNTTAQIIGNTFNNPDSPYEFLYEAPNGSANAPCISNYWSTTNIEQIKDRIYDWFDEPARAIVDFEPILTLPNVLCPTESWSPLP